MKRLSLILVFWLISMVCIDVLSQGFLVWPKGREKPDIILNVKIDSIYFDTDEAGCFRQNFATPDGIKSYNIDDIDHIAFHDYYYIETTGEVFVCPKETYYLLLYWYGVVPSPEGDRLLISGDAVTLYGQDPANWQNRMLGYSYNESICDTIYVTMLDEPMYTDQSRLFKSRLEPYYHAFLASEEQTFHIKMNPKITPRIRFSYDEDWLTLRYLDDGVIAVDIEENPGEERECVLSIIDSEISLHYVDGVKIVQLKSGIHSAEEHMTALRDLYEQCDGSQWTYQENWLSDRPIHEWDCVNHDLWGNMQYRTDRVLTLDFTGRQYHGLKGALPESFTILMDDAFILDLAGGALTSFPYNIRHHKRWPEFGWSFICQNPWFIGNGLDYTDINLQLTDQTAYNYKEQQPTTLLTELNKHKYSWVIHAASTENGANYAEIVSIPFMNKYLDYAPKGLGFIFFRGYEDQDADYKYNIDKMEEHGVPSDIIWVDHFGPGQGRCEGSMSLFDDKGNLIWHAERDWAIDPQTYVSWIDPILREHLGDPVEHDPYNPEIYISTDYSRDGELTVLQQATEGNGINVVFMGDGYVDTAMDSGGVYETQMRNGMEILFSAEPLKSLRSHFNVYMIKVVSPNTFESSDATQRINRDLNVAAEYIAQLGIDIEKTHVCVIENKSNEWFISGVTAMFDAGGSFAVIDQGGASDVIIHEVGGHGIGKLLDEYISGGFESNKVADEYLDQFKAWIKSEYHDKGWGMNVSASSLPTEVPWAHMLTDEYYSKETSIYKGAWNWPEDLWRPTENSAMNHDYRNFNAPGREAIYKYVMSESEGATWTYDFEKFKEWDMSVRGSVTLETQSEDSGETIEMRSAPMRKIVKTGDRYEIIPVKIPVEVKKFHVSDMRPLDKDRHLRWR